VLNLLAISTIKGVKT